MSTGLVLLIALAYLVPLALIAWLLSECTKQPRWIISGMLILLPVFYIGHYLSLDKLQGWPSKAQVPETFDLLSHEVTEPNIKTGDPGEILLWLRGSGQQRPRVHALPYSKALHKQLVDAEERQSQGHEQQGHRRSASRSIQGDSNTIDREEVIEFEDTPRITLPEKPTTP